MKYEVVVTRCGSIYVEAESKEKAMEIAETQPTDSVNWDEDWHVSDCNEFDVPSIKYITKGMERAL